MKTTVEALKDLYAEIGGESDTANLQTIVDVLKIIYDELGGESDTDSIQTIPDMVHIIKDVAGGGGASGTYVEVIEENNEITLKYHGFTGKFPFADTVNGKPVVCADLSDCTGMTAIPDYAFATFDVDEWTLSNTNLENVILPSGITSIDDGAFNGCTSLALTSLPSGITSIDDGAFNGCTSLALTSLPSGITSIGDSAFGSCTSLALTSLPSGLASIGGSAFDDCTSLVNMEIPCSLTGTSVFSGCTGLEKVWLRSTCTTITAAKASATPFVRCSTSLAIYAEPSAALSGWGTYFNRTGSSGGTTVTVTYDQTTSPF